ncbi:MAG: FtsQ-type POTRA domain-containing protein [Myxococcota bacterium]
MSLILAATAFGGAAIGVHYGWKALCASSRLRVAGVDLRGNVRVNPADVHAFTGIEIGDSILTADLDAASISLRQHPWVKTATVSRRLPDRVVIDIEEYTAALIVAVGDLYLATVDGKMFKRLAPADGLVMPVVTGIDREAAAKQTDEVAELVRDAVALMHAVERDGTALGRLDELHWDKDLGWSIVTRLSLRARSLRIHLGRQPETRIPLSVAALDRLRELAKEPEVIWADGIKNPGRVHVRLRSAPCKDSGHDPIFARTRENGSCPSAI